MIVLMSVDNSKMYNKRTMYVLARNRSYMIEDSSAMKSFDKIDLLLDNSTSSMGRLTV